MATVRAAIYKLLQDDAKIGTEGHLGSLLGHTSDPPYGVFFMNPPEKPKFPLITYSTVGETGSFPLPHDMFVDITVWGGDCDAIQDVVYNLLNDARVITTDLIVLMLRWIKAGPDIFDDNYKVYTRKHGFQIKGVEET